MIQLHNIHVTFNRGTPLENEVLRGLNLKVDAGEFVTIIGSNGAGKSTLMNILAGDIAPNQGKITIDQQDVTRQQTEKRATHVARVFQDPLQGSCAPLSIEENLALALSRGRGRGLGFALNKSIRADLIERLASLKIGLEKRMRDPMGSLSGGQRQAVSLLMATLRPARVLLLDEHTAALDPKMARVILKLTDTLVKDLNISVFMITHSMSQALDHGTRTILMHHGKIIKDFSGENRSKLQPTDLHAFFDEV